MEVICIEDQAFYALLDKAVERIKSTLDGGTKERWVDDKEAMLLLKIKSRTTLQHLRDEGKIRFSQPQKRVILYDRLSIAEYLEKHAKDTF